MAKFKLSSPYRKPETHDNDIEWKKKKIDGNLSWASFFLYHHRIFLALFINLIKSFTSNISSFKHENNVVSLMAKYTNE